MWRVLKSNRATRYYRNMRNFIAHWQRSARAKPSIANPPTLLSKRLRLLGLDPSFVVVAQPETLRRLSESCRDCAHTDQCAADLGADNANAGMDSYCANGDRIDDLVIKRSRG
jgi:hypothetical protein